MLRLPLYHCKLNPIELIWGQIKAEIRKENPNDDQTMANIDMITRQAISNVTAENWQKCIRHTRVIKEEYIMKDNAVDHLLENFIINLEESSSEEC